MLKNLVIFALLFALFAYQHGDDRQPAAGATQSQNPANPTLPASVGQHTGSKLQQDGSQEQATDEPKKVRVILPPKDKYDYLTIGVSITLAAVGIVGIGVGVWTLCYIRRQAVEMRHQRILMRRTLNTVRRQANTMESQAKDARESGAQTYAVLKEQTDNLLISAKAATASALAAQDSAKAAMGVAVPTLMLHKFAFLYDLEVRDDRTFLRYPKIKVTVKNFGKSPAFLKAWNFRFVWDELPSKPIYDFPYPCDVEEVIEADETYTLDPETTEAGGPTPEEVIDAIIAGKKDLTVYGFVSYGDVFGSPIRYMKFCKQLVEFDLKRDYLLVMDHGGYEYTGQHEHYDAPNKKWTKPT